MSSLERLVTPEKSAALVDAIGCIADGFALFDADDALVFCNRVYRDLHASIEDLIAPGVQFETLVRAGLDRGEGSTVLPAETEVRDRLARYRRADGVPAIQMRGQKWLMSTERRTPDGGVVVVETDITGLKKAEIARYEFLAKVSHELRTPLTPIHGALALMTSGKAGRLSGKLEELVDLANRNCTRLMSIVNDLLDFTRISAGRFSLNLTRVELEPFLKQVVAARRIAPGVPNIDLSISPRAKGVELDADPLRIQQVLDNLLANAIKFTPSGGGIEVNVDRNDGALRMSVVDHGPGIPKDFQACVFDVFAQAAPSPRREGVGLGLSICKSIVEAHGGRIGFVSKDGEGTTFFFELPLAKHDRKASAGTRARRTLRETRDAVARSPQQI